MAPYETNEEAIDSMLAQLVSKPLDVEHVEDQAAGGRRDAKPERAPHSNRRAA